MSQQAEIEMIMHENFNMNIIGADSPDIAERVIKKHKENKKMSTILCVANLIAETPCKVGVANHVVAAADPNHKLSGTQRLRELAKRFRLSDGAFVFPWPYEYRHNRYYPTAAFKRFCKRFIKERS
jgi:hypothetical protein